VFEKSLPIPNFTEWRPSQKARQSSALFGALLGRAALRSNRRHRLIHDCNSHKSAGWSGDSAHQTSAIIWAYSQKISVSSNWKCHSLPELPPKGTPEIFVSYAWGDDSSERRTEVVDRLCETPHARVLETRRLPDSLKRLVNPSDPLAQTSKRRIRISYSSVSIRQPTGPMRQLFFAAFDQSQRASVVLPSDFGLPTCCLIGADVQHQGEADLFPGKGGELCASLWQEA
jgi:hypothetical protein